MNPITIAEAAQKLPEIIDAALRGEEVIITKGDRSEVKLIPATSAKSRQPVSAKDMVWVSDDFDEPLDGI
jgi:antitoxin (DNA-binding transcriptional repressor) of toxin-antitoxin stability system